MAAQADPVICLSVSMLELIAGLSASLFILLIILKETCKGNTMSTKDKVLFSLTCSHVTFSIVMSISMFKNLLGFNVNLYVESVIAALILHCSCSGSFLTMCLCLFYFFKIIQFKCGFLFWVKVKIDVVIPWMMAVLEGAFLCFAFLSVMLQVDTNTSSTSNSSDVFSSIIIAGSSHNGRSLYNHMVIISMFVLAILLIAFIAVSLAFHVHGMVNSSAKAKAQGALKSVLNLLTFYLIFFSLVTVILFSDLHKFDFGKCFYCILQFAFIPVQCGLLIHSNPKYKKACRALCMHTRIAVE